jgi:membrane-associated protein
MFFSLQHIFQLLLQYKYLVIFPFAVFEGPIITIISGFLVSIGVLNFWVAFTVVAAGDLFADNLYYAMGRFGREKFLDRFGHFFGLNPQRVERMELHFQNHPWKIFTFGKFAHGTGSIILTAAGLSRVPYLKFISYNIPTTFLNSFILLMIGFYFGHAYQRIDTYLGYYTIGILLLVIVGYFYFIRHFKPPLD